MPKISRRSFVVGAMAAAPSLVGFKALGQPLGAASNAVSVIDASVDTSSFVDMLERAGVQVVARYLSRGCQTGSLSRKRIAFNPPQLRAEECGNNKIDRRKPEHESLLEKFALISAYQYYNDNPAKFAFGLAESNALVERAVRSGVPRELAGARVEAEQDAQAALVQSARIRQPGLAPIYFGVDFNMLPSGMVSDLRGENKIEAKRALNGCLEYFRVLKQTIGDRLGVYGNGYINRILRQEGLVRFSWISESRSFKETPNILREGFMQNGKKEEWHLFQHLIDAKWIDPSVPENSRVALELDGNVHNPTYDYFGAWTENGLWRPDLDRSRAVLKDRRVAKRNAPIFDSTGKGRKCGVVTASKKRISIVDYHRSVRVHGDAIADDGSTWLHVDVDDDGIPEGYCFENDFVGGINQMPDFDGSDYRKRPEECQTG
jgi:hypothetical protein